MKTNLNLLTAAVICCTLSSAALAQENMMVQPRLNPRVGPVLQHSEALGLAIESHSGQGLKVAGTTYGGATASHTPGDITLHVRDVRSGRILTTTLRPRAKVGPALAVLPNLGVQVESVWRGGYKIVGVERYSVAEEIGLATGDILRTVNGQPIENLDGSVFNGAFTLVYDSARTGYRMTLRRSGWFRP